MKNNVINFFNLFIFVILFFLRILPNIMSLYYFLPLNNIVFWYFVVFINSKMNLSLRLFKLKYSLKSIL